MSVTTLEEGFADSALTDLGWTVTRTGTDLQKRIAEHDAVIRTSLIPGGISEGWQRVARLRVEIFTASYDKAWETAYAADEFLLSSPYRVGPWLVDRCSSESDFTEQFYAEGVRLLVAVYRVTTRTRP